MIQQMWRKRMLRWLDKRIPSQRRFQLGMSNIFIFPSKFGLSYIFLAICLFILGNNYSNNLMLLMCFFLVGLFLVNLSSAYSNFAKIQVQIGRLKPVFAGEDVTVPLWFEHAGEQDTPLPYKGKLHLKIFGQNTWFKFDPFQLTNPATVSFVALKRGAIRLPRITLQSFFPIGLYRCWTHLHFAGEVIVYPKPIPCPIPVLSRQIDDQATESDGLDAGQEDFDTLSNYRPGEPMHLIAWKQVAKGQGLVSKRFTGSTGESAWLSLQHMPAPDTETALGQLTWLALQYSAQQHTFGLDLLGQTIAPDSGNAHLETCLKAIALYQPASANKKQTAEEKS